MNDKERKQIQKEIVDSIPVGRPHGRIIVAQRVGKTKLAIDMIKREKPNSILWVSPSEKLLTEDIPEEFTKWKAKRFLPKLTTSTWASLKKVTGEFDVIILDEEQHITENNAINLLTGELKGPILSMTGTKTKHEDKQDIYRMLRLNILYELDLNEAVDIGILANYKIKVIEIQMNSTDKNIEAGTKDNRFMVTEAAHYEYLDRMARQAIAWGRKDAPYRIMARMRAVYNSPSKTEAAQYLIDHLGGRKLIFAGSIDQAETLSPNTYHSKTDNTDLIKFQSGETDIISMVNAGGTGFTYKTLDHLLMVQSDSDKNGQTSQKISRTLLKQKDYKATIWILCLKGTQDEKWVESTLQNFDSSKIEYIDYRNLLNKGI